MVSVVYYYMKWIEILFGVSLPQKIILSNCWEDRTLQNFVCNKGELKPTQTCPESDITIKRVYPHFISSFTNQKNNHERKNKSSCLQSMWISPKDPNDCKSPFLESVLVSVSTLSVRGSRGSMWEVSARVW